MPTVRNRGQTNQAGYHTRAQIEKVTGPTKPRDEIVEAYAGDENDGPFGDPKASQKKSTNLKSRKTEKSKRRVPIR